MRGQSWWIRTMLGVVLAACSGTPAPPGSNESTTGGASGAAGNAVHQGGASARMSGAGASTKGGTTTGGSVGAQGGTGGAAGSFGGPSGFGGSAEEPQCIIEFLHVDVSGGMTFERSTSAEDECGLALGNETSRTFITLRLWPPEVGGLVLMTIFVDGLAREKTAIFTPSNVTVIGNGSVWTNVYPQPEDPLQCRLKIDHNEATSNERWRLAGSVTCPSAVSGIDESGHTTTLELNDYRFSLLAR